MAIFRKFKAFMGPLYYEFKDPDTGVVLKGKDLAELKSRIVGFRSQNELEEIPMLDAVIENYLCGRKEHRYMCRPVDDMKRGWWGYIRGGVALLKSVALGKMVPQSVGETRALQCSVCPLNEVYSKSVVQAATDELMEAAVEGKRARTSVHNQLGNCGACSCCLKFKVFAKGPFQLTDEERKLMESVDCWQLKDES